MVDQARGNNRRGLGLVAVVVGWLAGPTGCVLYDDAGPTSTELYALIEAHCQSATTCRCGWSGHDADTCLPELEARWKARLHEGQRRELVYDAACMATIAETIEQYACYWPGGDTPLCADFCAVFHGQRASGEPCEGDDPLISDCAQGLVCDDGECVEPCSVIGGRALGSLCSSEVFGPYDDCAPGLWCSWDTGRCEQAAGLGEQCVYGNCGAGLRCNWQTDTCLAAPLEGESCGEIDCDDGLYCEWVDYDSGICLSYAAEGEDCENRRCLDELYCDSTMRCVTAPGAGQTCLWGAICDDDSVCDFDRCEAKPEAGSPCRLGTCASGAWCSTSVDDPVGVCMPPQENGEMCSGHPQCQSRYCPNGFCWPAPAEGDDCGETGACSPGLVCNGTTCEISITRGPAACSYPGW